MNKTETITLRTTEKLKYEIVHLAKLQGVSSGQLIRTWIDVLIDNQVLNFENHFYQLKDGRIYSDMKTLCNDINISSRAARKRVKTGVIKKITINPYQTQKYGDELQTANSGGTKENRIQV